MSTLIIAVLKLHASANAVAPSSPRLMPTNSVTSEPDTRGGGGAPATVSEAMPLLTTKDYIFKNRAGL